MEFIQENKIRTRKLNLKDYNFEEIKLSIVFKLFPYLTFEGGGWSRVQQNYDDHQPLLFKNCQALDPGMVFV